MPDHTVKEGKKKSMLDFLTKGPRKNKKIVGGKRTVDAVTGPKHKKVKPKTHKHPASVRMLKRIFN